MIVPNPPVKKNNDQSVSVSAVPHVNLTRKSSSLALVATDTVANATLSVLESIPRCPEDGQQEQEDGEEDKKSTSSSTSSSSSSFSEKKTNGKKKQVKDCLDEEDENERREELKTRNRHVDIIRSKLAPALLCWRSQFTSVTDELLTKRNLSDLVAKNNHHEQMQTKMQTKSKFINLATSPSSSSATAIIQMKSKSQQENQNCHDFQLYIAALQHVASTTKLPFSALISKSNNVLKNVPIPSPPTPKQSASSSSSPVTVSPATPHHHQQQPQPTTDEDFLCYERPPRETLLLSTSNTSSPTPHQNQKQPTTTLESDPHPILSAGALFAFEEHLSNLFEPPYDALCRRAVQELQTAIYCDGRRAVDRNTIHDIGALALGKPRSELLASRYVQLTWCELFTYIATKAKTAKTLIGFKQSTLNGQLALLDRSVDRWRRATTLRLLREWHEYTRRQLGLRRRYREAFVALSTTATVRRAVTGWKAVCRMARDRVEREAEIRKSSNGNNNQSASSSQQNNNNSNESGNINANGGGGMFVHADGMALATVRALQGQLVVRGSMVDHLVTVVKQLQAKAKAQQEQVATILKKQSKTLHQFRSLKNALFPPPFVSQSLLSIISASVSSDSNNNNNKNINNNNKNNNINFAASSRSSAIGNSESDNNNKSNRKQFRGPNNYSAANSQLIPSTAKKPYRGLSSDEWEKEMRKDLEDRIIVVVSNRNTSSVSRENSGLEYESNPAFGPTVSDDYSCSNHNNKQQTPTQDTVMEKQSTKVFIPPRNNNNNNNRNSPTMPPIPLADANLVKWPEILASTPDSSAKAARILVRVRHLTCVLSILTSALQKDVIKMTEKAGGNQNNQNNNQLQQQTRHQNNSNVMGASFRSVDSCSSSAYYKNADNARDNSSFRFIGSFKLPNKIIENNSNTNNNGVAGLPPSLLSKASSMSPKNIHNNNNNNSMIQQQQQRQQNSVSDYSGDPHSIIATFLQELDLDHNEKVTDEMTFIRALLSSINRIAFTGLYQYPALFSSSSNIIGSNNNNNNNSFMPGAAVLNPAINAIAEGISNVVPSGFQHSMSSPTNSNYNNNKTSSNSHNHSNNNGILSSNMLMSMLSANNSINNNNINNGQSLLLTTQPQHDLQQNPGAYINLVQQQRQRQLQQNYFASSTSSSPPAAAVPMSKSFANINNQMFPLFFPTASFSKTIEFDNPAWVSLMKVAIHALFALTPISIPKLILLSMVEGANNNAFLSGNPIEASSSPTANNKDSSYQRKQTFVGKSSNLNNSQTEKPDLLTSAGLSLQHREKSMRNLKVFRKKALMSSSTAQDDQTQNSNNNQQQLRQNLKNDKNFDGDDADDLLMLTPTSNNASVSFDADPGSPQQRVTIISSKNGNYNINTNTNTQQQSHSAVTSMKPSPLPSPLMPTIAELRKEWDEAENLCKNDFSWLMDTCERNYEEKARDIVNAAFDQGQSSQLVATLYDKLLRCSPKLRQNIPLELLRQKLGIVFGEDAFLQQNLSAAATSVEEGSFGYLQKNQNQNNNSSGNDDELNTSSLANSQSQQQQQQMNNNGNNYGGTMRNNNNNNNNNKENSNNQQWKSVLQSRAKHGHQQYRNFINDVKDLEFILHSIAKVTMLELSVLIERIAATFDDTDLFFISMTSPDLHTILLENQAELEHLFLLNATKKRETQSNQNVAAASSSFLAGPSTNNNKNNNIQSSSNTSNSSSQQLSFEQNQQQQQQQPPSLLLMSRDDFANFCKPWCDAFLSMGMVFEIFVRTVQRYNENNGVVIATENNNNNNSYNPAASSSMLMMMSQNGTNSLSQQQQQFMLMSHELFPYAVAMVAATKNPSPFIPLRVKVQQFMDNKIIPLASSVMLGGGKRM